MRRSPEGVYPLHVGSAQHAADKTRGATSTRPIDASLEPMDFVQGEGCAHQPLSELHRISQPR